MMSVFFRNKYIKHVMAVFIVSLASHFSNAGVMELGSSYGIRNSSVDADNYTKNESWTGSFAWYFLELSALEFSYTKGLATQSLKAQGENAIIYYSNFEMYGADLVITLGSKTSFLQPFVRGGMARLKKDLYRMDTTNDSITKFGEPVDRVVPSYGFGLKIKLTENFGIKGSYDRWKSGSSGTKDIWDDSIKAGVSWYF